MGDKDECPICLNKVNPKIRINCLECMTCHQKIHSKCLINWNNTRKLNDRLLQDDILVCPVCKQDSIAYCYYPDTDINADIKEAVAEDPNRTGGKTKKYKKSRKHRKSRKSRKSRKHRRTRK
jgi:hypothetical protein